jgi:hypothetical protein
VQRVGQSFDSPGLAGSRGSQQEEDSGRAAIGRKPRLVHLHVWNNLGDGVILADDAGLQLAQQLVSGIRAA